VGGELALGGLDGVDDGDEQALLRAEVIDEHAVAGADRRRQLAQAEVGDAVRGDVLDRSVEQPPARIASPGHEKSVPFGTP
jgi:hypothetical protein